MPYSSLIKKLSPITWERFTLGDIEEGVFLCEKKARVSVKWKSNKWYSGYISEFDPYTHIHTIIYDDGDIREYFLPNTVLNVYDSIGNIINREVDPTDSIYYDDQDLDNFTSS
uniref:Uncharacterized protein n=1 Tax=Megaviridae environmental sample TaxID=1737588 RepID=A0A5J6VHY7_9VIRU|nr:MAG: hypothetical protein [Megaviridae environmental sample]